jgi:LysR family glycine cleavage system transcriptional activator
MHHVDFAREDVDLAIRHGTGDWPGLDAVNLCAEELFPVCSPALPKSRRGIHSPEDVLQFPLLHLDDRRDWSRWLEVAGSSGEGLLHGPILNHASMLIDAAINGQGIALARTTLVATDLIDDRLIRPFQIALPLKNTYWIRLSEGDLDAAQDRPVRDWLLAEAAAVRSGSGSMRDCRPRLKLMAGSAEEPSDRAAASAARPAAVLNVGLRISSMS